MKAVSIRGFINSKFGSTYGKGVFRRALYTGSIELQNPIQKYYLDFYEYADWVKTAKELYQLDIVNNLASTNLPTAPNLVMSWVIRLDPAPKTFVEGFCAYLQDSAELHLEINDPTKSINHDWDLPVRHCKNAGDKLPLFIATNVDLNTRL